MSFTAGTVLHRKVPFEAPDEPTVENPDFTPYNEVEVIGHSPVQTGVRGGEWQGQLGDLLSIRPVSFGAVVDRAYGELQRDYEVVSIPDIATVQRTIIERPVLGPSPEQQFAEHAAQHVRLPAQRDRGDAPVPVKDGRRGRTVAGPEDVDSDE